MKKNLLKALVLCIGVSTVLSACSLPWGTHTDTANDPEKKATFFINPKSIGYAYWDLAQKGAMQAGQDLGVDVIFNGYTDVDSTKQINMIDDMLTRGVKGIAVAPNDAQAVSAVFAKARAQNVQVVTFDSDAPTTDRQYYIGPETDEKIGAQLIDIIANDIGGKGDIAFMVAGLGAENQIAKVNAAKEQLKKYPDIKLVATVSSNDEMQVSLTNMQNLIKTYPDLDGVVGFAGGEAPSAAEAVEQAVKTGDIEAGQIKITGIGWPNMCRQYIKNGTIHETLAWQSESFGYACVYMLNELNKNEPIPNSIKLPNGQELKVEGTNVFTGILEITQENVDDYDF